MADLIFVNNASALLATSISAVDTTVEVQTGLGARFPQPSLGVTFFYAALEDDSGNFEVVRCTQRVGDLLTVVRAQDNTSGQAFTQGVTRVEVRGTAVVFEEFLQRSGDVLTGDLDLNGNAVVDAVLNGPLTRIEAGEIVNVPLRGDSGVTSNEIIVPSGGGAPTIGGSAILKVGDDLVAQLDTAGVIVLDSATVGVRVPSEAYVRVEGTTNLIYGQFDVDADTDFRMVFANLTDLNILSLSGDVVLGPGIGLRLTDQENLAGANLVDFSFEPQTFSGQTTVDIDYEAGSYVTLNLNATQTVNVNVTNVPVGKYAAVRIKVVQDATGGRDVTNWPGGANTEWAGGNPPNIGSMGANTKTFLDFWTDNGGTTWYGGFSNILAWS